MARGTRYSSFLWFIRWADRRGAETPSVTEIQDQFHIGLQAARDWRSAYVTEKRDRERAYEAAADFLANPKQELIKLPKRWGRA